MTFCSQIFNILEKKSMDFVRSKHKINWFITEKKKKYTEETADLRYRFYTLQKSKKGYASRAANPC